MRPVRGFCLLVTEHRMQAELLSQRGRFSIQGDLRLHRAMCVPALSFVMFATSAVAQPGITRPDGGKLTPAQIDSTVNRLIKAAHVIGAGVALFHRGKIVYLNAYGLRDTEKDLPLTTNSVMTAASLNKSAFATVVMRLVQRGTLDLDKPIEQYLGKPLDPTLQGRADLLVDPDGGWVSSQWGVSENNRKAKYYQMDIARPDVKQRKKKRRQRIVWAGVALVLVFAVFLAVRFEDSPRHEYVTLKHDSRTIQALVVFPKVKNKALVVILVHEIFGLSDWAKNMADELADEGFIVIAPDMISGYGPKGGGYSDFASQTERESAISGLDPDGVLADLDAAVEFGEQLPSASGKIAVVGFSWGGWKSFAFATHRKDLNATFVFYGTGPADVTTISAPVYGFYGGNDGGVDGSVPAITDAMTAAGKFYDPVTYEGADHGFMRLGEDHFNNNPANKTARDQAFARLVKLLRALGSTEVPFH